MSTIDKAAFKAMGSGQRAIWLAQNMRAHFAAHWQRWAIGVMLVLLFNATLKVGVNMTESLPDKVFLVTKLDHNIHRGDYVSFAWHGAGPYPKGINFVKIARGVPGDTVTFDGRNVYINGEFVAHAKSTSKTGQALALGPSGIIPPGKYFVYATHKDSLDSRYALTGWIDAKTLIGRAYGLY